MSWKDKIVEKEKNKERELISEINAKIKSLRPIPNPEKYFLTIGRSRLNKLQLKYGWQGKGSQEDPIIIDNVQGLPPHLRFEGCQAYIIFRNVPVFELFIERCKNITIEGCKLYRLVYRKGVPR